MWTAKTYQTGRMPRLIRVFAGRSVIFWFCYEAAHIQLYRNNTSRGSGFDEYFIEEIKTFIPIDAVEQ